MRKLFVFISLALFVPAIAEAQYQLDYVMSWPSGPNQYDLAVAPNGNVYVIDINTNDVRYFSPTGQLLGQWVTTNDDPGGLYGTPSGLAIGNQGHVYVVDTNGILPTAYIHEYGSGGGLIATLQVPGPAHGICFDDQGNFYTGSDVNFPDTTAGVSKYNAAGQFLMRFPAPDPRMFFVDHSGNLFVSNLIPGKVQKFAPDGTLTSETSGSGACSQFNIIWGIADDGHGNAAMTNIMWPAPPGTPNLILFAGDLSCVQSWRLLPPPGDPEPGNFLDLAFDGSGNMYIADTTYHRILKYRYTRTSTPTAVATWGQLKSRYR